jgi:hypothetical protein
MLNILETFSIITPLSFNRTTFNYIFGSSFVKYNCSNRYPVEIDNKDYFEEEDGDLDEDE